MKFSKIFLTKAILLTSNPQRNFFGAAGVFLVSLFLLLYCAKSTSLVWDEPIYIQYSDSIRNWAAKGAPLDSESLESAWAYNKFANPHPPFMKLVSALGAELSSGFLSFPLSYRLGHCIFSALIISALFILLTGSFGGWQALIAIIFIIGQPRFFGELYVATTDGPVALGWIFLSLLSWKITLGPPKQKLVAYWSVFLLVYAAISATKLTGFLGIIPCAAYFIWKRNFPALKLSAAAIVAACALITILSPEHWHNFPAALSEYFFYLANRKKEFLVHVFYLGKLHGEYLPWHYFLLLSIITLPLPHLFLSAFGVLGRKKISDAERMLLLALFPAIAFWIFIGITPFSPKHDGVRQFLPIFPYLGIVAWIGLRIFLREINKGRWAVAPLALLAIFANARECRDFPRTYYNSLIGGLKGAEEGGFEIVYWLEILTPEMLAWINTNTPNGATIAILPPWFPMLKIHQERGLLRPDLVILERNFQDAQYLLVGHARNEIRDDAYEKMTPLWEIRKEGVSLAKVVRQN